jgi:hypothetical protein
MKLEQGNRLGERGLLVRPREYCPDGLKPPEIVGQVENPVLEARSVVSGGERSVASAIGLWSPGCGSLSASSGLSHRDPPTTTARPTIGWTTTPTAKI